ncbi:MAG TPA: MBL fold metallo-hydrolase [Gemmatimonadaceae bacterium]|nr:MBL fold metallo-hydrolase [Gemmatimonadaceae bacterium]
MTITRRAFIGSTGSCAAHLALLSTVGNPWLRATWGRPQGRVVAQEPFGALEQVADGIWAMISNPLGGDRTTLSNGGIVAGRNAVLAIEGFNQPAGAAWLASQSRTLTGRWPTHVAVTHYHSDHANGVAGYMTASDRPAMRATDTTRAWILDKNAKDAARADALRDVIAIPMDAATTFDLGGRTVRFVPRLGHTQSDVSIELDDPSLVFCGDLLWNAMVPNYVDAIPSKLSASVRALRRARATTYVPGHGAIADGAAYDRYIGVIDEIEKAARAGHAAGRTAAEAAAGFTLPDALGKWTLFSPQYFERAIGAWYREMDG